MLNKICQITPNHLEDKKNKVLKKTPHTTSSKQYLHSTTNKVNNINFSNFETHQKKVSEHFLMHRKALFKKKEVHKAEEIMNHIPINGSSTTYKQKLNQVQQIIKDCRQLSSQFGYFYITAAMVEIQEKTSEVQCWIHPIKDYTRPLHPIRKKNEGDAEKQFYVHLKLLLKDLFPTISLPQSNNYFDLIFHINKLKNAAHFKLERKTSYAKLAETTETLARVRSEEQILKQKQRTLNQLILLNPPKFIRASCKFEKQITYLDKLRVDQNSTISTAINKSTGSKNILQFQKNTMSTLLGSIKSNEGMKQRIQQKVPYFEREYEGKKSVIVENKKQESSSQGFQSDFDQLFSSQEREDEAYIEDEVARQFQDILN